MFHFSKDTTDNIKLHLATAILQKFLLNYTKIILSKYENHSNWSQGINMNQGSWEGPLFITFHFFRRQWNIIWQVGKSLTGQHALLWLLWFLSHCLHYLAYYIIVNCKGNCCLTFNFPNLSRKEKGSCYLMTNNRSEIMGFPSSRAIDYLCITQLYHTNSNFKTNKCLQTIQGLHKISQWLYIMRKRNWVHNYMPKYNKKEKYLHQRNNVSGWSLRKAEPLDDSFLRPEPGLCQILF